jgi:hypothetical protein
MTKIFQSHCNEIHFIPIVLFSLIALSFGVHFSKYFYVFSNYLFEFCILDKLVTLPSDELLKLCEAVPQESRNQYVVSIAQAGPDQMKLSIISKREDPAADAAAASYASEELFQLTEPAQREMLTQWFQSVAEQVPLPKFIAMFDFKGTTLSSKKYLVQIQSSITVPH